MCCHSQQQQQQLANIVSPSRRLLALALPLAGQNILAFSLSLISVGFIGHLGKYELSVAVLATSLYNLTGNSVIQGMAGGMETLCGQVWVGACMGKIHYILFYTIYLYSILHYMFDVMLVVFACMLDTGGETIGEIVNQQAARS